jgi:RND family efflux transporter MFP subunit
MNASASHKIWLLPAGAFLGGLLIASAFWRARPAAAPPPPPESRQEAHEGEEHAEHGGAEAEAHAIRLDPIAVRNAGIRVEMIRPTFFGETLTVPGTVEAGTERVAKITPPAAGKIARVLVSLGDTVRAGQTLVTLDSYEVAQAHAAERQAESAVKQAQARQETAQAEVSLARAGLAQARAEEDQTRSRLKSAESALANQRELAKAGVFSQAPLQSAQSELSEAQSERLKAQAELQAHQTAYQRTERLFKEGLVSRMELEQAQLEQRQDQARLDRAQARVETARQTLAREQRVFRGDLLSRQAVQAEEAEVRAAQGESVERSTTLFVLENLRAVLVQANVPEKDIARVRVGLPVTVTAASYPNQRFSGRVRSLASRVDEKTRTLAVRCLVENPAGRLRPEMFAQVSLRTGAARRALRVPQEALVEIEGKTVVFVQEGESYHRREVAIGKASGGAVEIVEGLRPGERVVTEGAFVLKAEAMKEELSEEGHGH